MGLAHLAAALGRGAPPLLAAIALLLVLAGGARLAWPAGPDEFVPAPGGPLLRLLDQPRGGDVLVRADPLTLAPASPALRTFRDGFASMFSPDRQLLALGEGSGVGARLQLVDVPGWSARTLRLGGRGPVWPLAWPRRDRLLVGLGGSPTSHTIALVDPGSGRVLGRSTWRGYGVTTPAAGPFGVVMLLSRPRRLRPARLLHIDAEGRARSVRLSRIEAGYGQRPRGRPERRRTPGLAVDPERGRAYVVAAGAALAAEVELASGRVTYHRLARRRSAVLAFQSKGGPFQDWFRTARWLGDGLLALTGENSRSSARSFRFKPFGLRLIDTSRWRISVLDRRPAQTALAGNRLLATGRSGPGWDRAGRRDAGLLVFDTRGRRAYKRFPGEDVSVYGAHERRAYVWVRRTRRLHTLDVGTGRSLHVERVTPSQLPVLLLPEGAGGGA